MESTGFGSDKLTAAREKLLPPKIPNNVPDAFATEIVPVAEEQLGELRLSEPTVWFPAQSIATPGNAPNVTVLDAGLD